MAVIMHNITAMNTNRQLGITSNLKSKTMERLSSGYRINRASDDAAGLAISEKMRSQIRGLNKGVQNTEDGISLCQVADGALNEVCDMLHRMSELSVQAANGTNTDEDRDNIQDEVDQLLEEIDRIAYDTEYNTMPVFKTYYEELPPKIRDNSMSSSVSVTGTPVDTSVKKMLITATEEEGFFINGQNNVGWDNIITTDGTSLEQAVKEGTYSLQYNGLDISFKVTASDTLASIAEKITDTALYLNDNYTDGSFTNPVTGGVISNDKFYSWNNNFMLGGNCKISADDSGMTITNVDSAETKYVSWNDKPNGSTKTYNDIFAEGTTNSVTINLGNTVPVITLNVDTGWRKKDVVNSLNDSTFDIVTDSLQSTGHWSRFYNYSGDGSDEAYYIVHGDNSGYPTPVMEELLPKLGFDVLSDSNSDLKLTGQLLCNNKQLSDLRIELTGKNGVKESFYITADSQNDVVASITNSQAVSCDLEFANASGDLLYISFYGPGTTVSEFVSLFTDYGYDYPVEYTFTRTFYAENLVLNQNTDNQKEQYYTKFEGTLEYTEEELANRHTGLWIQSGAREGQGMYLHLEEMDTRILGLSNADVSTMRGAEELLTATKGALAKVTKLRSIIGAQQNRLEHTASNGRNMAENVTASESRIRDVDMAYEVVQNSKFDILQQTGQAMLSQANHSVDSVINLLQQ